MKPVEEAFASRSFRRVVLPGIVLTIGIHPLISGVLRNTIGLYGVGEGAVLLAGEVVFWGLVVSSAVNWLYYVYEGFRLPWLTESVRMRNERLVAETSSTLSALMATYETWSNLDRDRASKLYETLLDFPLRRTPDNVPIHYASRANRLGNIIATYEQYTETRYGIDGVYYWFHLLQWAPAAAKADFDDSYDFAESLVITSFSGALIAIIHVLMCVGFAIARLTGFAPISLPVGAFGSFVLFLMGVAINVMFYYLALPAHREAGKIFRALVDASLPTLVEFIQKAPTSVDQDLALRASQIRRYQSDLRS
jgi:hypothetical protein